MMGRERKKKGWERETGGKLLVNEGKGENKEEEKAKGLEGGKKIKNDGKGREDEGMGRGRDGKRKRERR